MGSKNLKAVAVRGTRGIAASQPDAFFDLCAAAHDAIRRSPRYSGYWDTGTAMSMDGSRKYGLRIAGHYDSTAWDRGDDVSSFKFFQTHPSKRAGCFACPMQCMNGYNLPGLGAGVTSCMGYTELIWKMKLADMETWWEVTLQCEKYGLDVITVSSLLGWLMGLWEHGVIDERDTGGVRMEWGSRDATVGLIDKIVRREGFGELLAQDPLTIARTIGRGAEDYMVHVKGLPLYGLNYTSFRSKGLAAAVGVRGDQIRGSVRLDLASQSALTAAATPEERSRLEKHYVEESLRLTGQPRALFALEYEGKARLVADMEDLCAIDDLMIHCKWHSPYQGFPVDAAFLAGMYEAGCGESMSAADLQMAARRVRSLERAYDVRDGVTRERDVLPGRLYEQPMPGFFPDDVVDRAKFEAMKDEYYGLRDWDVRTGIPTRQTLEALDLADVADDLASLDKLPAPVEAVVST
jgi:aldehyde:ferredoxin oxidoreductase